MAKRRHYETSKIRQIRCAVDRYDKLNNKQLKGTAKTVQEELEKIQRLLFMIKSNLAATERLFLRSKTWAKVRQIEEDERQQRSFIKSILQGSLSKKSEEQIDNLKKLLPDGSINSVFSASDYNNLKIYNIKLIEYEKLISSSIKPAENRDQKRLESSLKRKETKRLSDIKRTEKEKQTKAMAAAYAGKTRQLAQTIKRNIEHQRKLLSFCPYCNNSLGDKPEADHIYPVAKGGLSTEKNMVYICSNCNSAKSDKTLRNFAKQKGLDIISIGHNLDILRKDF